MATETVPAGFVRRAAALFYDTLLLFALLFLTTALALALNAGDPVAPGALRVAYLLVGYGFYTWFWTHGGQTLGMRAWRLRLVAADGGTIGPGRASVRFAAAALSFGALGLGFVWMLFDREGLTWHDRLSATRVIVSARAAQ